LASNLVIVAIPKEDDDVWKVSSEKVPHLTILFLGDALTNPNVAKIVEKTKTESRFLEPFSLLVDHRGTLGPDEADVLFFGPETPWQLHDFRSMLLGQQEIAMAYNAIPQRTVWKPHLTLGYPDTPAHPDDWDPMGTQYVSFDKVAVWYGDSEGSEFMLTPNPKAEPVSEVGWADQVGDILAHYGVKGMRWGVRRSKAERQANRAAKKTARAEKRKRIGEAVKDEVWTSASYSSTVHMNIHNAVSDRMWFSTVPEINRINHDPKYKDANLFKDKELRKSYEKDVEKLTFRLYDEEVRKQIGVSPSGKKKAVFDHDKAKIKIVPTNRARHADEEAPDLEFTVKYDANGFIIEVNKATVDAVAQGALAVDDILEHYGVKGMRWGHRKDDSAKEVSPDAAKAAGAAAKAKKQGKQALSNEEMQALVTRMNLERQLTQLTPATRAQKGQRFVASLLANAGKQQAQLIVNDQVSKQLKKAIGAR